MHIIGLKLASGQKFFAVCSSKKPVFEWKEYNEQTLNVESWRYHDGSGWADGSHESYKDFMRIAGETATIIL